MRKKQLTVDIANLQIQYWIRIRDIMLRIQENEQDDINTRIIKKYLKLGSVVEVSKELNTEGYSTISKSTGNPCKYTSNDISGAIRDTEIEDIEMQDLAKLILKDHTAFINRLFN